VFLSSDKDIKKQVSEEPTSGKQAASNPGGSHSEPVRTTPATENTGRTTKSKETERKKASITDSKNKTTFRERI
jgi:hypothetical protein